MTVNILFAAHPKRWAEYEEPLHAALSGIGITYSLKTDFPPEEVDYIVYAPNSELQDFTPYTRARAVLNLWAGVEHVAPNPTLKIPLARMVGGGLTEGMVEWVTGHALRHHLGMDAHIVNPGHDWTVKVPPIAAERPVTILGLGALGLACARALRSLGFPVTGWSRGPKTCDGIATHHGPDGLTRALTGARIVILLLPDTPATENVLNAETLALTAPGAFVINPGRGTLIDDDALIAALDSGQIAHATLDVFRTEPLPADHPFWAHPTGHGHAPYCLGNPGARLASEVIAENIRRGEAGEPLPASC